MASVLLRTLTDTLRRDPWVKLALAGCAALAVFYLVPIMSVERRLAFLESDPPDMFFFAVIFLAFRRHLGRIADGEERRFWNVLTVAFTFWFLGSLVSSIFSSGENKVLTNLIPDFLYAMHYGAIFYAVQRHRNKRASTDLENAMRWPAVTAFVLGLVLYFVVIPSATNLQEYYASEPDNYLYIILDSYISFWLMYNSWSATHLRWRVIYGCLAIAIFSVFANDLLGVVYLADWGIGRLLVWYLQFPVLVGAIRVRHHALLEEDRQLVTEASRGGDVSGVSGQTLSFALLFPLIHLAIESTESLGKSSESARQLFMIFWLLGFGALAWIQHRALEKRNQQLEDDTRRFISQLEMRGAELAARNFELARFNYTVSHDLRNPLVTIRTYAGMVQRDVAAGNTERLTKDAGRITAAADRMNQLLDELLELSRIGRLVNPPEEVALGALVREAAELLADEVAERGVTVEIAPDLPTVVGDRPRLLQMLQNLLHNAVSYLGDQPEPRIEVGARPDADEPLVYVRDNGIGIEPRYHEQVFGLFERLDAEAPGTGVGLALVKRIVEVHGGRIWVESEGRGQGSTFCFTLPAVRRAPPAVHHGPIVPG